MKISFPLLANTMPPYIIAIIVGGGILFVGFVIFFVFLCRGSKAPEPCESDWIEALGGNENIVTVSAIGSRINLSLKDKDAINRERLTELGVKSVLVMSNKVTLVVNEDCDIIANKIRDSINN